MRRTVLTVCAAALVALGSLGVGANDEAGTGEVGADLTMVAVLGDGREVTLGPPDDEDAWLGAARRVADGEGRAVAVCQGGKLVCVVDPSVGEWRGEDR